MQSHLNKMCEKCLQGRTCDKMQIGEIAMRVRNYYY